ncbi:alpha-mannosidase [Vampirovibrio chlorellavorus]|uniref:alpha-mannosidase n=1 Tax=Vampirovibrio chlorellavorus TaxID=758823 RepID=UPI0026EFC466|nr:glycoside hydrolase family 38 C-terminal domain-containing protein [Vampirovibrio chlorellavorus]
MGRTESEQVATSAEALTVPAPLSVYYHTHWDREWYLPFRAYQLRLVEVVDDILERLESGVFSCFMLDGQTVVLEDYLALRPQQADRLRHFIQYGQLSIGPWYVMPDEFLVGGESLIRNLALGLRQSRDWGCKAFTGYLPDTFGHSADMPTLFQHCGLDSAVVWRGVFPKKSVFQWQSPAGHLVKTLHLTDGYFQMMLQDWTAEPEAQAAALRGLVQKLKAVQVEGVPPLLPMGGDHLGPLPAEAHQRLKALYPNLQATTPDAYLRQFTPIEALETVAGELVDNTGSFLLPGVYSARMYLKQANRRLEHALVRQLEPLLAMAQGLLPNRQAEYPEQALALAWQTLILNHPHDSICGCSVDAVHRENEVRFDQVAQIAEGLRQRSEQRFRRVLATGDEWIVFNTSGQPYTGVVPVTEDVPDGQAPSFLTQQASETAVLQDEYLHDSQRIPLSHLTKVRRQGWIWVENIPPLGYAVLNRDTALGKQGHATVLADSARLENDQLRVSVDAQGRLSVEWMATGQRFEDLLTFTDRPDQGDSYNSGPVPGTVPQVAVFTGSRVVQAGPLVGILALTHHFPDSDCSLVTQVRLDAGSARLDFETTFINHASQHKLQAVFNTGQPIRRVVAESHLGVVARTYDPAYREVDRMPVAPMQELATNTGPVQRFLSANGQGFVTEGLCEYEVFQDTLAITLLRAFGALSSADTGVRGAQAGPPFETPEGQCLGRMFRCRYAWTPQGDEPSALFEMADRFYGTVWGLTGVAQQASAAPAGALITVENPEVVVAACYWSVGQGWILRLLNPTGQEQQTALHTGFECASLWEVNFLEERQQAVSAASVTIPARSVKTLLFAV